MRLKTKLLVMILCIISVYILSSPTFTSTSFINTFIINGNEQLATSPYVTAGNGTIDNPFIIDGIDINQEFYENGMEIINIDEYLIIRNITIHTSTDWMIGNGLMLINVTNCTIYGIIVNNFNTGIYIGKSYNISVKNCIITNNRQGLAISDSSNITITGNKISENSYYGIGINYDCRNILIVSNVINVNYCGISLFASLEIQIFHNDFISNDYQANTTICDHITWDNGYPSGGNYWSDYEWEDEYQGVNQNLSGSDGIGDRPYYIDMDENQDNYPLMEEYIGEAKNNLNSEIFVIIILLIIAISIASLIAAIYLIKKKEKKDIN